MKKQCVLCAIAMTCISFLAQAQNGKKIDSLIRVIPAVPDDKIEAHVDAFREAIGKLSVSDALKENRKAMDVCKESKRPYALLHFQLCEAGLVDNVQGLYQTRKKIIEYARSVNDPGMLAAAYQSLGDFQGWNYLHDNALINYLIADSIALQLKDEMRHFNLLSGIMVNYMAIADYPKASEVGYRIRQLYLNMSESEKRMVNLRLLANFYNNMGLNLINTMQYDSSIEYFNRAVQIAREVKYKEVEALSTGNRGSVYYKMGQNEKALPDLFYDIRMSKQSKNWGSAINAMLLVSKIRLTQGNVKIASVYLDSARYLNMQYEKSPITADYWKSRANLEYALGNYKIAREMQELYTTRKVESVTKQAAANLAKIQNSFELKSKQKEIDGLTESAVVREEQLSLQRYALIAALVALLLALALVINFIYNYRRQKRINAVIQKHREETMRANEELRAAYQDLQLTQNQLVQTEKMAFLGRLTSGIAHEINTPLGAIKASAENVRSNLNAIKERIVQVSAKVSPQHAALVMELISQTPTAEQGFSYARQRERKKACIAELKGMGIENPESMAEFVLNTGVDRDFTKWLPLLLSPDAPELFRLINKMFTLQTQNANIVLAVNRASKILFALKTYSHPGNESSAVDVNLAENVEVVLAIYNNNLTQIDVVRNIEEVPLIKGFPEELSQVWTNSIHNALQAMNGTGKLLITIARQGTDEVKVEITDNGSGITPENQKRLFEPFFTTKSAGEGTGLGLSIIKKIMEKHKGRIECESKVMRGTTFRFIFPVS